MPVQTGHTDQAPPRAQSFGVKLNEGVQPKKHPYQNNLQNEEGYCLEGYRTPYGKEGIGIWGLHEKYILKGLWGYA